MAGAVSGNVCAAAGEPASRTRIWPSEPACCAGAWVCLLESRGSGWLYPLCLAGIGGVCALIKLTFLVEAALTVGAVTGDAFLRGNRKRGLVMIAGFGMTVAGGWALAGQKLRHLPAFLANGLSVIQSYDEAMRMTTLPSIWRDAILGAALGLVVIFLRTQTASAAASRRRTPQVWLLRGWLTALLFLAWKQGMVRARAGEFAAFLPVFALALEAVPSSAGALRSRARRLSVACFAPVLLILTFEYPGDLTGITGRMVLNFRQNLGSLCGPRACVKSMSGLLEAERARSQLPTIRGLIGQASVDVFGHAQAIAFFNDLNYQPRPVFQSYAAYNPHLMQLNNQCYQSVSVPGIRPVQAAGDRPPINCGAG